MFPSVFITDLTANGVASTAGDWQYQNTTTYTVLPPNRVCGIWRGATLAVNTGAGTYSTTPDQPAKLPTKNSWNFGAGSSPLPYSANGGGNFANEYGTMAVWYIDKLGLVAGHQYRFEYIVHDGDQNNGGGDAGEACIIASSCPSSGCPPGQVQNSACSCVCAPCPSPKVNDANCNCGCPTPSTPCVLPNVTQADCSCACATSATCVSPATIVGCACVCPTLCDSHQIQNADCSCSCPTPFACPPPLVQSSECSQQCVCPACANPLLTPDLNNNCACSCVQPPPPSAINWGWNAGLCEWICPPVVDTLCKKAGYSYNDTLCACGPPSTGHNKHQALVIGLAAGLGGGAFLLFAAAAAYLIHRKKYVPMPSAYVFGHRWIEQVLNCCCARPLQGHDQEFLLAPPQQQRRQCARQPAPYQRSSRPREPLLPAQILTHNCVAAIVV
jgi:hypothetical protein